MPKDRNTMAKRQREVEKRDKAARKREKMQKRHAQGPLNANDANIPESLEDDGQDTNVHTQDR